MPPSREPSEERPTDTIGVSWLQWPDGTRGLRYKLGDVHIEERGEGRGTFTRVRAARLGVLKTPGGPALPVQRLNVILADGATPEVTLAGGEYREIHVEPPEAAVGFISRSETEGASRPSSGRPSSGRGLQPARVVRTTVPFHLRSVRGAGVVIHPFQYDYSSGILRIWDRIDLKVEGAALAEDVPELPSAFAEFADVHFVAPLSDGARRGADVGVSSSDDPVLESQSAPGATRTSSADAPGHLLVIAADVLADALGPYVEWKRQRGFAVTVKGYPSETGSGAAGVAAAIQTAYDEDGITHVLLLGDVGLMPVHSISDNPTDIRYACVDGSDLVRDVYIARLSANTAAAASHQLANVIAYEQSPDTTDPDWYRQATFIGSDEGEHKSGSTFNLDDWELLDLEREDLTAYGYTSVDRMYDYDADNPDPFPGGSPGPQDILDAWNQGRSLIYYLGHGTENKWVTGSLYSADVDQGLSNGARLPFIIDAACLNGDFTWTSNDCIAEVIMEAGQDTGGGGAVGIVAATEDMDWDPPVIMMQSFTDRLVAGDLRTSGAMHTYSVQAAMDWCESSEGPGALAAAKIMEQAHLLGDPTLGIRSKTPVTVTVVHDELARPGDTFEVSVTDAAGGTPVAGADICLYHAEGIQLTARTDATGTASVAVSDSVSTLESLLLTVYAPNLVPVQKDIAVNSGPLRFADFAPPPALVGLAYEADLSVLGGTPPYTWSTGDVLPSGLQLDAANGTLHGTAAEAGTWDGTVTVEDADGATASTAVHLEIGEPVQIATTALGAAQVDTPLALALDAAGGAAPLAWSVGAGDLPPGVSLSADGQLSGTPARAGDYPFTVRVHCAAGSVDEADFTMTVAANPVLTIGSGTLSSADPMEEYRHTFTASGGAGGGYAWELAGGTLPRGLSLSPDGVLSGTPDRSGQYAFTLQVQDDSTPAITASLDVVLLVNSAVQILTSALPDAHLNEPYESTLEIAGSYTPFTIALKPTDVTVAEGTASTYADIAADFEESAPDAHWTGDEQEEELDLDFSFPYFGQQYSEVRIADNGYVVLGATSPSPMWEATAEKLAAKVMIAPFWTDLEFGADPEDGVFVRRRAESATILWRGPDYHVDEDRSEFAVTLHSDGRFVFHYGEIQTDNRVVVGYSDGGGAYGQDLYVHDRDDTTSIPGELWANHADVTVHPPSYPPAWLAVSHDGVLSGTPAQAGSFAFVVNASDTAGYTDSREFTLVVHQTTPADTNADGDVDNAEILSFIERWDRGEVSRASVETAVDLWRSGPAGGVEGRADGSPPGRTVSLERSGPPPSPGILRARRLRAGGDGETRASTRIDTRGYHSAAEIDAALRALAEAHPDRCHYRVVGRSHQGRPIAALLVSDQPTVLENEPAVGIVGAMHGDERIAAEIPLALAQALVTEYETNDAIRGIVDQTEVWILPCLNPDGLTAGTRDLVNGGDLNRIFPDGTTRALSTPWNAPVTGSTAIPETQAVMDWASRSNLTALLSFHSGATVVCYPYGNTPGGASVEAPTPDDDLFRELASTYAAATTYIAADSPFADGIVNGAAWYAVGGELTDWLYRTSGTLAMTVELSDIKTPSYGDTVDCWDWNRPALLGFLSDLRQAAVTGRVLDASTGAPLGARVAIAGRARPVFSDRRDGGFHRLLPSGAQALTVEAFGYQTAARTVSVPTRGSGDRITFALKRAPHLAVRYLDTPKFTPGIAFGSRIDLHLPHSQRAPSAVIIREEAPSSWTYVSGSTAGPDGVVGPGEPRIEDGACAWLLWGEAVEDGAFQFEWSVPAGSPTAVALEGELVTASMRTPLLGVTRLATELPTDSGFRLEEGWNLVSLELNPETPAPADIFAGLPGTQVWAWNGQRYVRPTVLEPGRGYWVYTTAPVTVRYRGAYESDALRSMATGWNLVGPLACRDAFRDRDDVTSVLSWSTSAYHDLPSVESGRGYWVFMSADGVLSLR